MVNLVKHDLEFILKQIEIAEAHAEGGNLAELVAKAGGFDPDASGNVPTQAHLLPYGLRTVDGSYNNLVPGREQWGASGQAFPGLFDPTYLNDADGDSLTFGPGMTYTNNDYGNAGTGSGMSPGPGSGTVIDADPRIISNLIVDQTLSNPAAIMTALQHAGVPASQLMGALGEVKAAFSAIAPLQTAADAATLAANNAEAAAISAAVAVLDYEGGDPAQLQSLQDAAAAASDASGAASIAAAQANLVLTSARNALDQVLDSTGIEMDGESIVLPNVSPDDGISSPYNGWMTIFGQFFDHGLDLVAKGGNGTVYVPLQPDDPLYVEGSHTNFMALTRVTVDAGPDGRLGTADDGAAPTNMTTPWIDQNQTYGSTASKQIFMREYVVGPDGKPMATGHLLEGGKGGLATWADIKAQARDVLGINLTDADVGRIPLLASDAYGNFIPGPNGYPQLVFAGPDNLLGTGDDILKEGDPAIPVSTAGAVLTGHAFLDDIAHAAVPVSVGGVLREDSDTAVGYSGGIDGRGNQTSYDNELLDAHFIAGDGRANENIALTAVHHVFHSEHNRLVEHTKDVVLESNDLAFLNEWLAVPVDAVPTTAEGRDALIWNGERLFQAARFTNEMEYQHLVFEEFGRMMQPDIDVFVFEPSVDINPNIAAEFAHVVYRFGHSMLREDIARISLDADGNPVQDDIGLIQGFLNPIELANAGDADVAAGAIIRGMSRQIGNEIDEFVTGALRNNLLGLPLDLATINLARGRDVGTPSLNAAREKFFDATQDTQLKPYESWADYALNLKNPASIINFIAAYGTHTSITNADTAEEKRAAATLLVLGGAGAPADRLDFLNGTSAWAGVETGLNTVDFWIGGLAEKKMSFGGMLGSTFSFVFEMTMENLQDADRFYYLSRTQGLNLLNELENNSFAELAMRNTDLGDPDSPVVPGNLFSGFEMPVLEMDLSKQLGTDPVHDDPTLQALSQLVERRDADLDGVSEYIRINSNEHFVIGGTENADTIVSGGGDDAIWGKGGDDVIEAGYGVDKVFGGEGDDIITNAGTDIGQADFLHGNEGNDVIHGGSGLALIFGNQGKDFLVTGPDGKEAFGGTGNDFILGGSGGDFLLGNEGDDWMEGGERFDTLAGDNSELMFNSSIIGHDVLNGGSGDTDYDGESGDDIMFQGVGIQRSNGMAGFDWAIHKGDDIAANSDLGIPAFANQEAFILRDRFDLVEGLSGWKHDDLLTGRAIAVNTRAEATGTAAIPRPDAALDSYSNALLQKNVSLIKGLDQLVAHLERTTVVVAGKTEQIVMDTADASDIILGGGGSDVITGLAGNDIIDGDRWLNVRIAIHENRDGTGAVIASADGMTAKVYKVDANGVPTNELYNPANIQNFQGMTLQQAMFDRTLNPGQLQIVREILDGNATGDTDIAVYTDVVDNYTFTRNSDGSITVDHTGFDEDTAAGDVEEGDVAPLSDGTDRLFNIEKLRFSDGNGGTVDYDIDALFNQPATGQPVISDLTPTEGQQMTLNVAGIQDLNGLGPFSYQWQSSSDGTTWTNIAGATGATFTPDDNLLTSFGDQAGQQLRVSVTFTDARGNVENVVSAATGPVGVNWDGIPAVNNTFNGTAGDDIADGVSPLIIFGGNDTLNGGAGNDDLDGSGGNDLITGGAGNDIVTGGAGTDIAAFAGPIGNYSFDTVGTNILVTDIVGTDGTDILTGIETLRFNNVNYGVTAGSNTGNGLNGGNGSQASFGFDGNDTITQTSNSGGRDLVNGGAGNDTYQLNGVTGAEVFRIYTRDAAIAAGMTGISLSTEIVITRNGTNNAAIIAELDNIEEIRVNALQVTSPGGPGGNPGGGDTIQVIGDFAGTSLNFNTITIDGTEGDDTVDIAALASAHRIVFRSNGGSDTIVGTLRAQDVIELPPGMTLEDYTTRVEDGITTLTSANHQISFVCSEPPVIRECRPEDTPVETPDETGQPVANADSFTVAKGDVLRLTAADLLGNDSDPDGHTLTLISVDEDEDGTVVLHDDGTITFTPKAGYTGPASFTYRVGNGEGGYAEGVVSITVTNKYTGPVAPPAEPIAPPADPVTPPADPVTPPADPVTPPAESPVDLVVRGGRGHDKLWGGDGDDRLYGGGGNDRMIGGEGGDHMWGGKGNDVYHVDHAGDRIHEGHGHGNDWVKSSVSHRLGANVENLVLVGEDDLNGIGNRLDNVLTGNSGNNVLKGGAGDDILRGGGGDDHLRGGAGNDWLRGGTGDDVFAFQHKGGRDTVTDFRHGQDRIDATSLHGVNQMSDLTLVQVGDNVEIHHGNAVLVLQGVSASDLDQSDFIF